MTAETTYQTTMRLYKSGVSQAPIAAKLGVSRQYVGQLVARTCPPGESNAKHGTLEAAATCACERCTAVKDAFLAALPKVCDMLRAGATRVEVTDRTGVRVSRLVYSARLPLAKGEPSLLGELVRVFDETMTKRPLGRPRADRVAA